MLCWLFIRKRFYHCTILVWFFIILSFYQVHQVLKFCNIAKASQNCIWIHVYFNFCNVQVSFSLIKFFINTKRFKKLLYCNMENINSILNRRKIYCYIIEEIIGLKLPDYQFMKYINNFENFSVVTQHSTNISITLCPLYLHIYIKIWNKIHIICSSR